MSLGLPADNISPEQAPPLAVPFSFFLTAPLFLVAAGVYLVFYNEVFLQYYQLPRTLSVLHCGTLGFLAMVMFGALYQMVVVVAGRAVAAIGLARLIHAGFFAAVLMLVLGFWSVNHWILLAAFWGLIACVGLYLFQIHETLFRAPSKHDSVSGMRLSVISLLLTLICGATLLGAYLGQPYAGTREAWVLAHISFGLFGWVGGLIMSVSWQVVPMFYVAPFYGNRVTRVMLWSYGLALAICIVSWLVSLSEGPSGEGFPLKMLSVGSSLLAFIMLVLHPLFTLRILAQRRRKNRDGSLLFWRWGLVAALLAFTCGVLGVVYEEYKWFTLFGWFAIFGWGGLILHGMLCRIMPFLVWFHRYSALVGKEPVPSMKKILPEKEISRALYLHLAALFCGGLSIVLENSYAGISAGVFLALTGIVLERNAIKTLVFKK